MSSMILHCGSQAATRAQVEAVPVPAATDTWHPLPYGKTLDFVRHLAVDKMDLPIIREQYGLNKRGDQMFGLITLDTGEAAHGLSIGVRGSYNKTLANAVAVGAQVFVCDNLAFSGSGLQVVRRNTRNVWDDFRQLVEAQIDMAYGHYDEIRVDMRRLKESPCNIRTGYAFLGIMRGEGLLTANQASTAYEDWSKPRHDEFTDRNLWGLYNAVTEGLKKGSPASVLGRHTKAHDWLMQEAQQLAA